MEEHHLAKSVAYCGLICPLCFLANSCDGCKSEKSRCERDMSDQGCFQKQCCIEKSLEGCWQCEGLPECTRGIFNQGNRSKVKSFALYITREGMGSFISAVIRNMKNGLSVEKGKDYDDLDVAEVHTLLTYGRRDECDMEARRTS